MKTNKYWMPVALMALSLGHGAMAQTKEKANKPAESKTETKKVESKVEVKVTSSDDKDGRTRVIVLRTKDGQRKMVDTTIIANGRKVDVDSLVSSVMKTYGLEDEEGTGKRKRVKRVHVSRSFTDDLEDGVDRIGGDIERALERAGDVVENIIIDGPRMRVYTDDEDGPRVRRYEFKSRSGDEEPKMFFYKGDESEPPMPPMPPMAPLARMNRTIKHFQLKVADTVVKGSVIKEMSRDEARKALSAADFSMEPAGRGRWKMSIQVANSEPLKLQVADMKGNAIANKTLEQDGGEFSTTISLGDKFRGTTQLLVQATQGKETVTKKITVK